MLDLYTPVEYRIRTIMSYLIILFAFFHNFSENYKTYFFMRYRNIFSKNQ